jgi:serine/threonine protein kinase
MVDYLISRSRQDQIPVNWATRCEQVVQVSLLPGTRIGEYEIVATLGAGGMGEVYRARDARLRRDVAIKILPRAFTNDRDRLKRFEREAQLLAALSHPNIAAIYGVEDDDSTAAARSPALVLELIEGETLRDRIARGRIRGPEAFKIARQVADALEAAHRQGIVHRDLKPENIRITPSGMVKVLDFGLAKAFADADVDRDAGGSELATVTSPHVTTPGTVVGTAAYMSPEQARGQAVDERTDLWAFGCVLYEMLTGRQPFPGATFADSLAAIVEREPNWSALPVSAPTLVRRLLRRCLQKDVRERLQSAGDARLAVEELLVNPVDGAVSTGRRWPARWLNLILLGSLAIATVALAAIAFRSRPPIPEVRFELSGGPEITPAASVAISPDGRQIAVAPTFEQNAALWLRSVDSVAGQTLAGTEGAFLPFWSPDGRSIGFFANRKLQKVDIESGVVTVIADAPIGRGAAWASDGTIFFAPSVSGPLRKVAAAGGAVSPLTTLDKGQNDHRAPQFLPDERHVLYYARGAPQVRGVFIAKRDGTEPKRLIDADAPAVFASGQLLFVRNNILYAQTLDLDRLEVRGAPVAIADSVAVNAGVSLATLATSRGGAIAYGTAAARRAQFAWFDRSGKRLASVGPPDTDGGSPSLSPDGRLLAFNRVIAGNWDIWTLDVERGRSTPRAG